MAFEVYIPPHLEHILNILLLHPIYPIIFPKNIISLKNNVVNVDNYNKESGWTSLFNLFSNDKTFDTNGFDKVSQSLKAMKSTLEPSNWTEWAKSMGVTNQAVLSFFDNVQAGTASINDFDDLTQQLTDSTSIFGSTLKEIGVNLLNFGINAAIMAGITLAVKAINDYIHEFENAVSEKPPN